MLTHYWSNRLETWWEREAWSPQPVFPARHWEGLKSQELLKDTPKPLTALQDYLLFKYTPAVARIWKQNRQKVKTLLKIWNHLPPGAVVGCGYGGHMRFQVWPLAGDCFLGDRKTRRGFWVWSKGQMRLKGPSKHDASLSQDAGHVWKADRTGSQEPSWRRLRAEQVQCGEDGDLAELQGEPGLRNGWARGRLVAHGDQCQIRDLWRRFSFRTRDQAWSLKSFCAAEFY